MILGYELPEKKKWTFDPYQNWWIKVELAVSNQYVEKELTEAMFGIIASIFYCVVVHWKNSY